MILYHGSTVDIQKIDLRCSKPNKDFSRGFYLYVYLRDKEWMKAM